MTVRSIIISIITAVALFAFSSVGSASDYLLGLTNDMQHQPAIVLVDDAPVFTEEEKDAINTYKEILKKDPNNKALNDAGITTESTDQEIVDAYHKESGG